MQAACVANSLEDDQEILFTYLPNPFTGTMQLESSHLIDYTFTSMLGVVLEKGFCKSSCSIGSGLAPGTYLLRCRRATGPELLRSLNIESLVTYLT